jgi:hypothetical protein
MKRLRIVLFGCGGLLLVGTAAATVAFFLWKQQVMRTLSDPLQAEAAARTQLGDIPLGYRVTSTLDVGAAKATIMTLGEPAQRLFVYFLLHRDESNSSLKTFFTDATATASVLKVSGIHIDAEEVEQRGTVDLEGRTVLYAKLKGRAMFDGKTQTPAHLITLYFECDDSRFHVGVWAVPATDDTVGPKELRQFVNPMNPCRT